MALGAAVADVGPGRGSEEACPMGAVLDEAEA